MRPRTNDRWLSNIEPNPRDLLVLYPSDHPTMWPIGLRVNRLENDDAAILEEIEAPTENSCFET